MTNQLVIHRYEVPVDDQWHGLDLPRGIQHVATRRSDVVEVWAYARSSHDDPPGPRRQFRVYGTGQPMPLVTTHVATVLTPGGRLVWHLVENCCPHLSFDPALYRDPRNPGLCAACGGPITS